jgi:hypothetical protein
MVASWLFGLFPIDANTGVAAWGDLDAMGLGWAVGVPVEGAHAGHSWGCAPNAYEASSASGRIAMFGRMLLSAVAVGAFITIPSIASAATLSVPATGTSPSYFTDSSVSVPAGESVTVSATGTWSGCANSGPPCTTGPDGVGGFPPFFWWSDPSAFSNTLIGSLDGASTWTAIGAGPTVVDGPGELLLATNDISRRS